MISLKDYAYLGTILVLLAAFAGYTYHERREGAAAVRAADARAIAAANAQAAKDAAAAQTQESQSAIIYKQAVAIPAVGDIGVVCERSTAPRVSLPAAAAGGSSSPRDAAADRGVGPSFDPSGAVLTRGRAADAQIAYLQRRVAELEAEMNAAP